VTAASADLAAQLLALQASVPQAMRERPQWLLWRAEQYEGDKKPRKVPYYVSGRKRNATQGSGPDREELASFELALQHLARGSYTGLGFAFLPGDQLIGVDIDGAIDDDGVVSERCLRRQHLQHADSQLPEGVASWLQLLGVSHG
jgi:primase-polymerase (primpol)-like protein